MNMDLTKITSITEYLDKLDEIKDKSLILIAVKDNAGYWLNEEIQTKLYKLGLSQSLIHEEMVGYVAAISDGIVICEQKSPKDGIEEYQGFINGKKIYILSKPYLSGNTSSIQIDGKEYSNNSRGLNIVVYDNESNRVVDRVSFDTHVQEYDCVHLKTHYDIGIFGWWYNANYGATLTYYALNRAVSDMGYSVVMLFRGSPSATMPKSVSIDFAKRHYDISPRSEIKDLCRFNDLCDTFLLGSDQLWNPDLEKVAGKQFFLDFANDDKRLIAYAQSFGNYTRLPEKFSNRYKDLVNRFDAVSVREDYASRTCEESFGVKASQVCDPVFLVDRECFEKLADEADIELPNEYLMCFILDPTREKIELCERVKEKIGLGESIYFTDLDGANDKAKQFENVKVFPSSSIENFIKAYQGANYIVTDSFHGTCLSVIFEKSFISLANHGRGKGRFESLMRWLKLEDRLFFEFDSVMAHVSERINYDSVRRIIDDGRRQGLSWLKNNLTGNDEGIRIIENSKKTPIIVSEDPVREKQEKYKETKNETKGIIPILAGDDCTGCGACFNACPTNSVLMDVNKDGFLKARINTSTCIKCQKCSQSCPVLHPLYRNVKEPECNAVMADDDTRFMSSSGGAFTLFAKVILERNGMVCGAKLDENLHVLHECIEDYECLAELRGSKYYQSDIGRSFQKIKLTLEEKRPVLFVGLPCQVAGLYGYLQKDYDQLYTVDLFCHGISSKKVFDKYLQDVHGTERKIVDLKFKAKEPWGWHAGINADFDDGSHYASPCERDPFYVSYLSSISKNNTCASCKFNRLPRQGDLTIGDFWGINAYSKELNDGKGTSAVLINNDRGQELIEMIRNDVKIISEVPLHFAVSGNHIIEHPYPANRNRELFFNYLNTTDFSELVKGAKTNNVYNAYYKSIMRTIPEEWLGLYELAKTTIKKANGRKIVTWIRSAIFEEALEKFYHVKVEFGVSLRKEACDGNRIQHFEVLNGKSDEYFVVSIDRAYDEESFNKLKAFGYRENVDYIYTKPKHIVFEGFDLNKAPYTDENGNTIEGFDGKLGHIEFRGRNNHITFGKSIRNPENIRIIMHGDAYLTVGDNFFAQDKLSFEFFKASWGGGKVVIGDNVRMRGGLTRTFSSHPICEIHIGNQTTFETNPELHANAGKRILIGRDCMFSHDINVWAGDGHSIFDVNTGKNTNSVFSNQTIQQNNLIVGNHVWVAKGAFLLHGTIIGDGSIVGAMSVVKGKFPNNCVIAGNPACQVRNDAAWARDIVTEDISKCGWEFVQKTKTENATGRKVLILGGTGRMSAKLTELCIQNGDDVTIANRGKRGMSSTFYPVKKLVFDRFDREETLNNLSGTKWDVIFDCSCYAPQCMEYLLSCVEVDRYIYISSFESYVYTKKSGINVKEDDVPLIGVKSESYTDPKDYGLGKYQSEVFLVNNYPDLNYAIVRPPFVMSEEEDYGDSLSSRVGVYVDAIVNKRKINEKNLDCRYSFTDSLDEANFLYFLAGMNFKGVVNFASQGDVSMKEVVSYVERLTGKKAIYDKDTKPYPFTYHPELTLDLTKCFSLGYKPYKLNDWLNGGEKDKVHRYIDHYMGTAEVLRDYTYTWLITECCSELGREMALQLYRKGYRVAVTSRDITKLDIFPKDVVKIELEVTDLSSCEKAVKAAVERLGKIDVLVNNAGINHVSTFEETPIELANSIIETNYWGTANMLKSVIPYMREQGYGTVINITSASAFRPRNYGASYVASKFAVKNLTYSMKYECQRFMRVMDVEIGEMNNGLNKRQTVIHTKHDCYKDLPDIYPYEKGFRNSIPKITDIIIQSVEHKQMPRSIILGSDARQQFVSWIQDFEEETELYKEITVMTDQAKKNEIRLEKIIKDRNPDLRIQNWLITGASEGFGKVLALRLLELGYTVTVTSRQMSKLAGMPPEIYKIESKLDSYEECESVINKAQRMMGNIDVLVNNATSNCWCNFEECDYDIMRSVFYVNYTLPQYMMKACIPIFRDNHNGTVVNISSIAAIQPRARVSTYSAAKAALEGLTRTLKSECQQFARFMAVELVCMGTNIMKNNPVIKPKHDEYKNLGLYTPGIDNIPNRKDIAAQQIINVVNQDKIPSSLLIGTESYLIAKNEIERLKKDFLMNEERTRGSFEES